VLLVQVVASKGTAEEEEVPTAGSMAHAAKGKLVSSMMKKYLAEAMVPMLLELKRTLEVARHPLLGQLLATLASLLKEHKNEVWPCTSISSLFTKHTGGACIFTDGCLLSCHMCCSAYCPPFLLLEKVQETYFALHSL